MSTATRSRGSGEPAALPGHAGGDDGDPDSAGASRMTTVTAWMRRRWRLVLVLTILAGWVALWFLTHGRDTLDLAGRERTGVQNSLRDFRDSVIAGRDSNPLLQFTGAIADLLRSTVDWFQRMLSTPNLPRPVPEIGWLGVVGIATWSAYAIANLRIALLVCLSFLSFAVLGYWQDSIDLLIVTLVAVAITVIIGIPVAVWIATSSRANSVITVLLDLMQTMPAFVYLVPITLFFGIGVPSAVVCTLIYALPPITRIAGHGIRSVSPTTIEATNSAGQSAFQRLTKVQLPMARKTIIVGLNQTTMAALSMATIAAFIDGPGLGQPVLDGLKINDVGTAFVPGLLIVVMAVMLDRTTTAASERAEIVARRGGEDLRRRRLVLGGAGIGVLVLVYLSRYFTWAAEFPESSLRVNVASAADDTATWVTDLIGGATNAVKDQVSYGLLNPMQSLLAESPWWLAATAIAALAFVLGGLRALLPTIACLAGILFLGLWNDAMITLNMTLVATVLVMALALVLGVWMARSTRVDLLLRPLLDAGQTIPPFVYLIPVLALFGPTRFTAIVAGVIYAAPPAIKLIADGVKAVPAATVEASRSTGATTWQEITKVQLPMARASLVLAANQGLLYVLAMAVIGGLVGAGALGYDVVLGFSRSEEWGFGLAAGLTIVLLGIMLDRITRAAAAEDRTADPTVITRSLARRGPAGY